MDKCFERVLSHWLQFIALAVLLGHFFVEKDLLFVLMSRGIKAAWDAPIQGAMNNHVVETNKYSSPMN